MDLHKPMEISNNRSLDHFDNGTVHSEYNHRADCGRVDAWVAGICKMGASAHPLPPDNQRLEKG